MTTAHFVGGPIDGTYEPLAADPPPRFIYYPVPPSPAALERRAHVYRADAYWTPPAPIITYTYVGNRAR
jgi:hypothetical protein